jgi:hypothetical protein
MRKFRFHLVFAFCFGVIVVVLSWLLISPDSPVESSSDSLKEFLGLIQIVATFLAIILSGNVHGGSEGETIYWMLVFAQWFIVGLGLSFLFRLRGRNDVA